VKVKPCCPPSVKSNDSSGPSERFSSEKLFPFSGQQVELTFPVCPSLFLLLAHVAVTNQTSHGSRSSPPPPPVPVLEAWLEAALLEELELLELVLVLVELSEEAELLVGELEELSVESLLDAVLEGSSLDFLELLVGAEVLSAERSLVDEEVELGGFEEGIAIGVGVGVGLLDVSVEVVLDCEELPVGVDAGELLLDRGEGAGDLVGDDVAEVLVEDRADDEDSRSHIV